MAGYDNLDETHMSSFWDIFVNYYSIWSYFNENHMQWAFYLITYI